MSTVVLIDYREQLHAVKHTSNHSYTQLKYFIDLIHLQHIAAPHLLCEYGSILIHQHRGSFPDMIQYYETVERTCIAAIECNNTKVINDMLGILQSQFNDKSIRLSKLLGLRAELSGQYNTAVDRYKHSLSLDPTNLWFIKRIATLTLYHNNISDAIKTLNSYTKQYSADESVWLQLLQCYLQYHTYTVNSNNNHESFNTASTLSHRLEMASYCAEELLLFAPENYVYHILYADILYSIGLYTAARHRYSQAFELNNESIRAMYGMLLSVRAVSVNERDAQTIDIYKLAYNALLQTYKNNHNTTMIQLLETTFQ